MKNFIRALKFAWPYRYRLVLSISCAFLAAMFWSLNFTAIYPVLKIISSDKNLQQWVDAEISETQSRIDQENKQIIAWTKVAQKYEEMAEKDKDKANSYRKASAQLARIETRLEADRHTLYRYQLGKKYIDTFFPTDRFLTLVWVLGLVVVGVALKGFFEFGQEFLVGNVVGLSQFDLRNSFYRKVINLDVRHFGEKGTHELMARFTGDVDMLGAGMKTLFGKVIAEPLRAIGCVVVACWISWQLTLMFLVIVPVALFVLTKIGRTMKRATRRLLERMSNIYKLLQESFQGIRVVKAFTMEPYERRKFSIATRDYYKRVMKVVLLDSLSGPVIEFLGIASVVGALLVGAYLVLNGETHILGMRMLQQPMDSESLLQLYVLLAAIADPVRRLSNVYTRLQSGAAAADRIFHISDMESEIQKNTNGPILARHSENIQFRDVCFSYEPNRPTLTMINLEVKHGETIAIVGKNGSGKTTLLGLLPRFYDPDHGSIFIDGINIRDANLRSLRQQISLVTQETTLFDDTIHNNIAYGHRRATREQVEKAAHQAFVHSYIASLPEGYDTRVGEAGRIFSGGLRQRIALARAFLRDPSILILDEFTNQADALSESEIHRVLREFMKNRTTFVITHRLNTLEIADRIVVLEQGRIESVGTHQELLAGCAVYESLHEAQFQRKVA
ncbi:MAG: ABC transporter ATP-binding protein [Gemmataceae bacterium]